MADHFVGRQSQIESISTAFETAKSGRSRLVMLVGEPGIGKTRMAEEFAATCLRENVQAHWARCYEDQPVPPYWLWQQSIRSYLLTRDEKQIAAELGEKGAIIAEVMPDIGAVPQAAQPSSRMADSESARFRFFAAVAEFLGRASESRALVLVFDDLQWADEASLKLLEFVAREAREARLLIVGTYRDVELRRGHALAHTLGELSREQLFERIILRGLTEEETRRLIELTSGGEAAPELARTVYAYTEGNPLFVSETARLLAQHGEAGGHAAGDWPFKVPEGVREVIGMRLDRLSESCNAVLTTASVVGREFTLPVLARLVQEQDEEQVLKGLEEALAAGVIEELAGGIGGYRFTHALIQETLVEELSLTRRVRLHAETARVLEAHYGDTAAAHAVELARHYDRAEAVIGTEKLVHYSHLAGQQALEAYAHEDARKWFERALEARGEGHMDEQRADLLYGLAQAQAVTLFEEDRPADLLLRAFDYYLSSGMDRKAVAAAANPIFYGWGSQVRGTSDMARKALSLVPEGSRDAGYILCRHGFYLYHEKGEFEAALNALDRALQIALRGKDLPLELRTRAFISRIHLSEGRWSKSLEQALSGLKLARQVDDPRMLLWLYDAVLKLAPALGDMETARFHLPDALELAAKVRGLRAGAVIGAACLINMQRGDWNGAYKMLEQQLAIGMGSDNTRVILGIELGRFSEAERCIEHRLPGIWLLLVKSEPSMTAGYAAWAISTFCRISGRLERLETARKIACAVLAQKPPWFVVKFSALSALGMAAVLRGDREQAARQYDNLASMPDVRTFAEVSVDRILGLVAGACGRGEQARQHFETAIGFLRPAGYLPQLSWSCCDYGELLLTSDKLEDRKRARELLEEALCIAGDLGMEPLRERIERFLKRAGSPAGIEEHPAGLTAREVEVLRLVAQGLPNKEIADRLFISAKTVATHLRNIFEKIDVTNRTEAAQFATANGLAT